MLVEDDKSFVHFVQEIAVLKVKVVHLAANPNNVGDEHAHGRQVDEAQDELLEHSQLSFKVPVAAFELVQLRVDDVDVDGEGEHAHDDTLAHFANRDQVGQDECLQDDEQVEVAVVVRH